MAHDVFISYAAEDKLTADAVCAGLEKAGIRCWIAPRDIVPSQNYDDAIIRAINASKVMVVIFSSSIFQSQFVKSEVERAFSKGLIIVPFRIENIEPQGGLELYLSRKHWLDAMTPPLENHIQKLVRTIFPISSTPAEPDFGSAASLTEAAGAEKPKMGVPAPGLLTDFPPLKTLDAFPNNLPSQLTSFVGREKEMQEVKELVTSPQARLLTLTGSGGTGKTRLALQAATDLLGVFTDGVWLVELAPLTDPALVVQTIASMLGVLETTGKPLTTAVADYLHPKNVLLILDNCEHLVETCARLAETLLQACPRLHILATSRENLGTAGETLFRVPSLSTPDIQHLPSLEILAQSESVCLFVERAAAASPGFVLNPENAAAVAQICHQLDGIPLAIELAAVRVRMLSVEQIATRLDDAFRLLTSGSRTVLPRHQTLKALIDWSYNLLPPAERSLLLRLTVFAGGWTLEAAEAVCAGDSQEQVMVAIQPDEILGLLGQLVDKSLVLADQDGKPQARYRMLETIRQYGRERLLETGGSAAVRDRQLDYFLQLAELAGPNLRGKQSGLWLDRLNLELDNLRAALEWSLSVRIEDGLRLGTALMWLWHIRGHGTEGIAWLERALAIDARHREGSQSGPPAAGMVRGDALNAAGQLLYIQDQRERSKKLLEESRVIFLKMGQPGRHGLALALLYLRTPFTPGGLADLAQVEQSLALFRQLDDKFYIAECLSEIGAIWIIQGEFERARQAFEESQALRKDLNDLDGLAFGFQRLGTMLFFQGEYDRAEQLFQQSLDLFLQVGNKIFANRNTAYLAQIAWARGDYNQAIHFIDEAIAVSQELGDQTQTYYMLPYLSWMAWAQGDYAQAEKMGKDMLKVGRETENNSMIAWSDYILARVALSRGDYAQAFALVKNIFTPLVDDIELSDHVDELETLAVLASAQGQMERSARLFGAVHNWKSPDSILTLPERVEREQARAAVRAALGEAAFAAAWAEGEKMTLRQAVEYALEEEKPL